jgi:hypothetical protein
VAEQPYNLVVVGYIEVDVPKVESLTSVTTVLLVPNPGHP